MTIHSGTIERIIDRFMPKVLRPLWVRVRSSRIGYRLAHGAFWATAGAAVSQSLMLVSSIIIARILGREHFGEYGIIFSTVGMFNVVAGFGLGTTATKYVAEFRRTDPDRAGRIIAMSSMVAIGTGFIAVCILLATAPWLAARSLAAPHLTPYLRIGTGLIFFGVLNGSQVGALAGFEAFRAIARINLVSGVLSFPLIVLGAYYLQMQGALAGQVIALGLVCLLNNMALRKIARENHVPLCYTHCWKERSVLISFSLPALLSGIMVAPVNWVCAAYLVNRPHGYAEMGLFNAANSWQKAILFLPGSISAIALPMLSGLRKEQDDKAFKKSYYYNLLLSGGSAIPVLILITIFSKSIMAAYGQSFVHGYTTLITVAFASFISSFGFVTGSAIASIGKMWLGFWLNSFWAAMYVAFAYQLIPSNGALGLALASLFAYIIFMIFQLFYLHGKISATRE